VIMARWAAVFFLTAAALLARPRIDPAGVAGELILCGPDVPAAAIDRYSAPFMLFDDQHEEGTR
jgi:hypothetical protein